MRLVSTFLLFISFVFSKEIDDYTFSKYESKATLLCKQINKNHLSKQENVQHINNFVGDIVQFQINRALCILDGQYDPTQPAETLKNCDLSKISIAEGWLEVMKIITDETNTNQDSILQNLLTNDRKKRALEGSADPREETVDQTVPIVVGAIIGAIIIAALTAYFVKQYKDYKKNKLEKLLENHPDSPKVHDVL